MTVGKLNQINEHYYSMFGDHLSQTTLQMLSGIDTVEELDEIQDELSAGEYDAAEAIIENR
jgi:hypothetical protein